MALEIIGQSIAELRKSRGATQEELARAVGVSTQAVSKWECGGTPDTELLPAIAEFFGVSVDRLFGRGIADYGTLTTELVKQIESLPREEQIAAAFEYCWQIQMALSGATERKSVNEVIAMNYADSVYSQVQFDSGITSVSFMAEPQYFMLLPKPKNGWLSGLAEREEYRKLFEFLGKPDVLDALYALNARESESTFTPKLLMKLLNVSEERAAELLGELGTYSFTREAEVELDDTVQKVCGFKPNAALIALLAIAKEIIRRPNVFYCFNGGDNAARLK